MKRRELAGLRFGRLVVVSPAASKNGAVRWNCRCDCGGTSVTWTKTLRNGSAQSCGCLRTERAAASLRKHGRTDSAEYRAWADMKTRCYNTKYRDYAHWGGRGITVCDAWRDDFAAFFAHVGVRPSRGHSIDRIDNERGYEPGNVRWATYSQQNNNRRPFKSRSA